MKITFKNVGQGDTIILEWFKEGMLLVGVIDCKNHNKINPVINYLKELKKSGISFKIEFIIVSHPHFDHYSGVFDLICYCEKEKLTIKYIGHSMIVHPSYIDWASSNEDHTSTLSKTIEKIISYQSSRGINEIALITYMWSLPLDKNINLFCIGPSDSEIRLYTKRVDMFKESSNEIKASREANLLSTLFLIQSNDVFIILTSDATIDVIDRIRNYNMDKFANAKLVLTQIPHHGSKENHRFAFWKELIHDTNCPAVVSAGENDNYSHPHKDVVKDFSISNFKIHATNYINGVKDYDAENKNEQLSMKLDMISEITIPNNLGGDQTFELKNENLFYIPSSPSRYS